MSKIVKKSSARDRIRAFFLKNVGKVVTKEMIQKAATNPETGVVPENWHQRLSELRVDEGYIILSWRDRSFLKPGQYLLENATPTGIIKKRAVLSTAEREELFQRDSHSCKWPGCGLKKGMVDSVGGGMVVLTADHLTPHSVADVTTHSLDEWQTLCARHQQEKKNLIDDRTGRKNLRELVRNAPKEIKLQILRDLEEFFKESRKRK